MNLMFCGDFHIDEKSIPEIEGIFKEIIDIKNQNNVDGVILTGDSYDTIKPTPLEQDCFSSFLIELNCPVQIIIAKSHESISQTSSAINHFNILNKKLSIGSEYKDAEHLYAGHFTLAESKYNYGSKISKDSLKQYKHVILGHQHSFEEIKPNIVHIGSIRYVNFAESQDKAKYVALCVNYRSPSEKWAYIPLKSPYPMKDVIVEPTQPGTKIQGKKWQDTLNSLSEKTKIRVIFKDFESYYSSINELEQFKKKFDKFQIKKDFLITEATKIVTKKEINLKETLIAYLDKTKCNDIIRKILLEEIE